MDTSLHFEIKGKALTDRGGDYVDASAASRYLGVSRSWFYAQYRPYLNAHRFGMHKRKYYSIFDLDAIRGREEIIEPAE